MKITQDDYLKIAVWWGTNETLDSERLNLLRGILLMGEMSKFLAVGQDFYPSTGFPIKVQGKGEQSTPGGWNNFLTFLVRREMPSKWFWQIILLDTVLIELFQISHNWVTECTLQAVFLLKLIQKLLDFFPICRISQCDISIQQKGKV